MTRAPDPALVDRFRRDLAISGAMPRPEAKLGLAVSGGPDSLALLLLAVAAYPGAVEAATVDHGLRAEAAEEAACVHRLCAELGVAHHVLQGADPRQGSVQERARTMRYAALGAWAERRGLAWVATAHQRDDVAEALLMRAGRGAGLRGLARMPSCRGLTGKVALVRPLLDWPRDRLGAILRAAGIAAVDDPSNRDPRHDRSRIRRLLAGQSELAPDRLARAAANLRDAEDALVWIAEREWQARALASDGEISLDPAGLPHELRRRLTVRAVETLLGDAALREERVERLLATLDAGGIGTIAGVRASAESGKWRFTMAPPRRSH